MDRYLLFWITWCFAFQQETRQEFLRTHTHLGILYLLSKFITPSRQRGIQTQGPWEKCRSAWPLCHHHLLAQHREKFIAFKFFKGDSIFIESAQMFMFHIKSLHLIELNLQLGDESWWHKIVTLSWTRFEAVLIDLNGARGYTERSAYLHL